MIPHTRGELINIKAAGCLSGTLAYLFSDLFASSGVQYVRIPKGFRAKVYEKTMCTSPVSVSSDTVYLQYTHDSSSGVLAPWTVLESDNVNSGTNTHIEKKKPLILRGFTGLEAFSVQTGVSGTTATYTIEMSPDAA